ncbi:MAG: hypothetical protein AAFX03_07765, partial [Pseudomonadota bacterium]
MRTVTSFAFLALAGLLTDFAWMAPLSGVPSTFAIAAFGVFALGVSAFGVAPALQRADWRLAALFSALFGLSLAGGAFGFAAFAPIAPGLQLSPYAIPAATAGAAAYGWLA